jgi:hypothetical protein
VKTELTDDMMDDLLSALQNDLTERIVEIRDECMAEIIRKSF